MPKADKVTIRLTPEQASALDLLIERGDFKNRSEAIRHAVDKLTGMVEEDRDKIMVKLPDSIVNELDMLAALEFFPSRDLGIRELLRDGLEKIDLMKVQDRKHLRDELLAERSAKELMDDVYMDVYRE